MVQSLSVSNRTLFCENTCSKRVKNDNVSVSKCHKKRAAKTNCPRERSTISNPYKQSIEGRAPDPHWSQST